MGRGAGFWVQAVEDRDPSGGQVVQAGQGGAVSWEMSLQTLLSASPVCSSISCWCWQHLRAMSAAWGCLWEQTAPCTQLSHYILRNGLLPNQCPASLALLWTGRRRGRGPHGPPCQDPRCLGRMASVAGPLVGAATGADAGTGPMLALRDYCAGLGEEFCATVASALHPVHHQCEDPPLSLPALPPS